MMVGGAGDDNGPTREDSLVTILSMGKGKRRKQQSGVSCQ